MKMNQLRSKCIDKLGGQCKKCGFSDRRALQIDHVFGDGADERREFGPRCAGVIYKRILDGERERYQILCANCNQIKKVENHEARLGGMIYQSMMGHHKHRRTWQQTASVMRRRLGKVTPVESK